MSQNQCCSTKVDSYGLISGEELLFAALDVLEDKDSYTIKVDLPGVVKDNVRVTFDSGFLTIEGERKVDTDQTQTYHRVERTYGRFVRTLNLGTDIDAQKIQATYKEGVLEVKVAKVERAKPQAIEIQVG